MTSKVPIELISHLCSMSEFSRTQAERIVTEVLSFYDESVDEFVIRRHRDLQRQGYPNAKIFALVADEIAVRKFPVTTPSERQIRRIIYG